MRAFCAVSLLLPLTTLALNVSAGDKKEARTITEADEGKTIPVDKGARIDVALRANPTTGYRWQIVRNNPEQLKLLEKSTFERPKGALIGAGGTQTFHFQAEEPGPSELELVYRRPFEKDGKVAKSFKVTLTIK